VNPRAILLLAVLALLAAGLTAFLVLRVPSSEDRVAQERFVFDYAVNAVDRVTVKRGRTVAFDLERDPIANAWKLREPALGAADRAKVSRLLSDLRFESRILRDLTDESPGGLERYGLVPPALEVVLRSSGRTIAFEVGASEPSHAGVYVRLLAGPRLLVVTPVVRSLFEVEAASLRETEAVEPRPR
jgi:hypothetical protein